MVAFAGVRRAVAFDWIELVGSVRDSVFLSKLSPRFGNDPGKSRIVRFGDSEMRFDR